MRLLTVLGFLFFTFASLAQAQNYPAYTSTYINDFADLLDPETEARILKMLEDVRVNRGVEMTVLTIDSRSDYGTSTAIEPFATGLFNYWGIGDAERNDGILILVARDEREMRIELGAGYPDIYDDRMKTVIDTYFLPYFRNDRYAEGIEAGVAETIKRSKLNVSGENGGFLAWLWWKIEDLFFAITSGGWATWVFGGIGSAGIAGGVRRYYRNKPRRCDLCSRDMERLSEDSDDDYLSHGQKVEESLKSKDYDVWYCKHDDHVLIEGYRSWFSRYKACDSCGFRTLHSQRTVISHATTSSTGRARIDYSCRNCDNRYSETVTIPKKSESSSGSSGSFGGGSSSGGGASGSW